VTDAAPGPRREAWTGGQAPALWAGGAVAVAALLAPAPYLSVRLLGDAGLFFVAAPLLLAGTPAGVLRRLLARPRLAAALRVLTRPLPAVLLFHILFAVSLLPPALAAEDASTPVLAGARLVLLPAAGLMWWPLLSPTQTLPRLGTTLQFVYIFVNWLAITAVFGWLLFDAGAPGRAGVFGLGPAQDRQLGAFALGTVSHAAYAVVGISVFLRWVRAEQALASPLHLYARVRRAGFDEREAGEIAGLAGGRRP
jgi:putative membrane protein